MKSNENIGIGDVVRHLLFRSPIYILNYDDETGDLTGRYRLDDGELVTGEFKYYELEVISKEEQEHIENQYLLLYPGL
jgi:hypothetical protein